ncbi:uncharacterized protein PADG_07226 [Paracoccidioides brasiliensis Pb18]|uniref:Uncharacterized protein n=1 Tax=Paracoccidioides brasiliensis (strain Pb18) TaxID=502780 RepID=C1GIZ0_PARBD|nr:uncharacterized protein PADG_07226 [Paracoccidioides brasiliensis Pb18]EEH42406.1 hypothetical protein PADG_07226 [Paracoccidioides brasiliensis Pb18]
MTDNDAKMAIEELETVVVSIGVIIAAVISSVIQRSSGAGSQGQELPQSGIFGAKRRDPQRRRGKEGKGTEASLISDRTAASVAVWNKYLNLSTAREIWPSGPSRHVDDEFQGRMFEI